MMRRFNYGAYSTTLEAQISRKKDAINTIWAFQQDQAGMTPFFWNPPSGMESHMQSRTEPNISDRGKSALHTQGNKDVPDWNKGVRDLCESAVIMQNRSLKYIIQAMNP